MLNKKQSKRRNSWKYGIILPALAAFIFLFQVKVVAQEKATEVNNSSQEKTKISISVDKNATDAELTKGAKIFKEEFDADVTFSNVTRNASGEITGIKVSVKDKTQSQDHNVSGSTPIKPFSIELEKSSNSAGNTIAFGNPNQNGKSTNKISVATSGSVSPMPPMPPMPPMTPKTACCTTSSATGYTNGPNAVNLYKGALFVVNGVQQEEIGENLSDLKLPKGQTIGHFNVLSTKEAKKKYGKKAKKGAVEIETKQASNFAYNLNNDIPINLQMNIPEIDMDKIMTIAANGVDVGMDVLANMDWQKVMAFDGISEEERKEIQEEMKRAQIEVQKAMIDLKVDMSKMEIDKEEFKKSFKEAYDGKQYKEQEMKQAMKEMEQAKLQMKEAQKQLENAQKELQNAQKEIEKKKALSKKS